MSGRIGLIVNFDCEVDRDYWAFVPPSASIHITRTSYRSGSVDLDFVRSVGEADELVRAVRSLIAIEPSVIAFACTSSSFVDGREGEQKTRDIMREAGARNAVTTSGALLQALAALRLTKICIATPYVSEIGDRLASFLGDAGLTVVAHTSIGLTTASGISRLRHEDIEQLALDATRPGAEALFISCTALSTNGMIPSLERRLGIPVITANQVTMWAALRAAGIEPPDLQEQLFVRTS